MTSQQCDNCINCSHQRMLIGLSGCTKQPAIFAKRCAIAAATAEGRSEPDLVPSFILKTTALLVPCISFKEYANETI